MAKQPNPRIDEELVRQMIGGQAPLTENVVVDTDAEPHPEDAPPPETASAGTAEPRRRRAPLPDFEKTFMARKDIRYRSALYVGVETKRKILDVVKKIGGERMTATSYVENILCNHLELYKDDINRIHKEQNSKNLI